MSTFHTQLRTYAMMDPHQIPDSVMLCYTDTSVTVHDKYPKGMYHELVLPRILPPLTMHDLATLRSLLKLPRETARGVLEGLRRDALAAKALIEDEMAKTHGSAWDILMGFHALPSVEHLHLHLISSDMLGENLKTKKHMNSFHPRMGFFLDIDEVIRWLGTDIEPSWFTMKAALDKKDYAHILKQDMQCPHCGVVHKTIPKLRQHLAAHFQKMKDEATERELKKLLAMDYGELEYDDGPIEYPGTPVQAASGEAPTDSPPESGVVDPALEGSAAESSTATENGLKRKHGEGDGPDVIDVDALPEPSQAKRQQVEAPEAP